MPKVKPYDRRKVCRLEFRCGDELCRKLHAVASNVGVSVNRLLNGLACLAVTRMEATDHVLTLSAGEGFHLVGLRIRFDGIGLEDVTHQTNHAKLPEGETDQKGQ